MKKSVTLLALLLIFYVLGKEEEAEQPKPKRKRKQSPPPPEPNTEHGKQP